MPSTPSPKPLDADRPYKEASELERAIRACEAYHTVHWDKDGHHYCDFCDQRLPSPGHSADCEPGKAFAKLRHEIEQQLAQAAEREGRCLQQGELKLIGWLSGGRHWYAIKDRAESVIVDPSCNPPKVEIVVVVG